MTDEKKSDTTPKDELFEAIDHFKAAASKLFDRAASSETMKSVSQSAKKAGVKAKETAEKIDKSSAVKKLEEMGDKLDPAFSAASKEAERVITKLGATAEPIAHQLSEELGKLTKRIGDALGSAAEGAKKSAKKADEEE